MNDAAVLKMFAVYDSPSDAPGWFVVRPHVIGVGTVTPEAFSYKFRTLDEARSWCVHHGLARLARDPDDDPVIVETWF